MSTNGNVWQPNKTEKWICPSGQEVWTRHPGPEFTIRLGRVTRAFTGDAPERREGQTDEEYAKEVAEHISDEELVDSARALLVAMVATPKLVLNPRPEMGELGPDDTGVDFWPLYEYGMEKYFRRKKPIQVGDGEVEVSDLETFREEPGFSGDGMDSTHLPPNPEQSAGDQGLVRSTGA